MLEKALNAKGDTWKDLVIAHDSGSNVTIVNMVTGGNAPDVFMEANPDIYRELKKMGKGFPLDDLYKKIGVIQNFPAVVTKTITVDGEMVKAPVALHVDGVLFYNKEVAAEGRGRPDRMEVARRHVRRLRQGQGSGLHPDRRRRAGVAGGLPLPRPGRGHDRQRHLRQFLRRRNPTRPCSTAPSSKSVFAMIRKFQSHADDGSANRAWNDTTNLVISGKALLQIHGDWMKGEFKAAGKVAGKDFGCINIPGTKGAVITVDAWGFLKESDPAKQKAEEDFASLVVDPQVQADFAAKKGSTPLVLNAPTDQLDECNKNTLAILKDPTMQHPTPHNTADADWRASIWQTVRKFWADPT